MTSLTVIGQDDQAEIVLNAACTVSAINPLIYGGFTEHMGRCIYGGLYEPDNTHGLVDKNGFRTDVMDAFRELQVPVVRWPGGNFVATYHWLDGVGPQENRPARPELAWRGRESNHFGTDEFLHWCRVVGTEPYIALNFGTGTLDEALGWLEYCNSSSDTYYANLRRSNGHEEPYGVKYWALGNEVWGPWQVGQMTKEDYAKKAMQWAKALKLLDPSIVLILCGKDGYSDWDRYVLEECITMIDMHSIHLYTSSRHHLPNVVAPLAAERAIQIAASLIDLARIRPSPVSTWPERPSEKPRTQRTPTICFDEWNVWDPARSPGNDGAEEKYDVSDALAVAVWLNVFVRQSRHLGMCNLAQSVNVISPLMTTPQGLVRQTTYWPLLLFSRYMRGHTLAVQLRCPVWEATGRDAETTTAPEWLQSTVQMPWLDVAAARDEHGWINLAVVNISETQDRTAQLTGLLPAAMAGRAAIQVFQVGADSHGVRESNMTGGHVGVREKTWDGAGGVFTFPKHSLSLLRWKCDAT